MRRAFFPSGTWFFNDGHGHHAEYDGSFRKQWLGKAEGSFARSLVTAVVRKVSKCGLAGKLCIVSNFVDSNSKFAYT